MLFGTFYFLGTSYIYNFRNFCAVSVFLQPIAENRVAVDLLASFTLPSLLLRTIFALIILWSLPVQNLLRTFTSFSYVDFVSYLVHSLLGFLKECVSCGQVVLCVRVALITINKILKIYPLMVS